MNPMPPRRFACRLVYNKLNELKRFVNEHY